MEEYAGIIVPHTGSFDFEVTRKDFTDDISINNPVPYFSTLGSNPSPLVFDINNTSENEV